MKKSFTKYLSLMLILVLGLAFTGCSKKADTFNTKTPYGTLTDSQTYASIGTSATLSKKALYDTMRASGYNYLKESIEEQLLASYIAPIKNNIGNKDSQDYKDLVDLVNKACYGTTDEETINNFRDNTKETYIKKYIDTMAASNVYITEANIYTTDCLGYYATSLAEKKYALDRIKAVENLEKLTIDGEETKNSVYITEKDIKSYFEKNYKENGYYEAIIVGYNTLAQAEDAMKDALKGNTLTSANAKDVFTQLWKNKFSYKDYTAEAFKYTDSDLSAFDSSLVSMVEAMEKDYYTVRPQQFGNRVYYIYLLNEKTEITMNDSFETVVDGETINVKDEYRETFATSSYISTVVNELLGNATLEIYDPLYAGQFAYEYENFDLSMKSSDSNVCVIKAGNIKFDGDSTTEIVVANDIAITVQNFYDKLESIMGVASAIDYFSNKALDASKWASKVTSDDITEYTKNYNEIMDKFHNGEYSSYGYTTEYLTDDMFRQLYYTVATEDEVLALYKTKKIGEYFYADYSVTIKKETSTADNTETVTSTTVDTSELYLYMLYLMNQNYYNNFYSINIQHILFYVDDAIDGTYDDPKVFLASLKDDATRNEFKAEITELAKLVREEVLYLSDDNNEFNKSLKEAMVYVVDQYISNGKMYKASADQGKDVYWSDYRANAKFDIYMKSEDLSTVTNTTSSSYVKEFAEGVRKYYNTLVADKKELDKDNMQDVTAYTDLIETNYGYHILGSYGYTAVSTAYYSSSNTSSYSNDGDKSLYINLDWCDEKLQLITKSIVNTSNNTDNGTGTYATLEQLLIYAAQKSSDNGIVSLPTSVETYIGKFYSTFTTAFTNDTYKSLLLIYLFNNTFEGTLTFADDNAAKQSQYNYQLAIAKNTVTSYADWSKTSDTLYAGWFEATEAYYNNTIKDFFTTSK